MFFMYAEETVIYSDILFLINFSLDYLCLFIAGRVLNCGGKASRLVIGAAMGGLYSFLPYLITLPAALSLPLNLLFAFLMTFAAFGRRGIKKLLLLWGSFIVSAALFGGLITAAYSLISQYSPDTTPEVTALSFCVICLFSAFIAFAYGFICRRKINTKTAEISFFADGNRFSVRLLADSGNLVTEPFSSLPVIIVVSASLPPPYDTPESEIFPLPIRAIPFRTSAGSSCFFGFRPERIVIVGLARKPRVIDAYIGIDTQNKSYSGYDGIIPTSLL